MTRSRSVRSGFEQRFLANLRQCGVEQGQRLIVGFSGGPDSLALSLALRRVTRLLELSALLVHVDHGLRNTSAANAGRCRELADDMEFAFRSIELAPGLIERAAGRGVEEQARRERYRALGSAATAWDANSILLGHQADDQAETVLLHLFRGAGLRGLGGMHPVETRIIPWWNDSEPSLGEFRILRPLLSERRQTIDLYLAELEAAPILDESNASMEFDRNWVRHRVLPTIETRWSSAVETITRTASVVRLDSDYLDLLSHRGQNTNDRTLCTDKLKASELAPAYQAIASWLRQIGVDGPGLDVVARVYEFALNGDEAVSIELGAGQSAVLANGRLMTFEDLFDDSVSYLPLQLPARPNQWQIDTADGVEATDGWMPFESSGKVDVRTVRAGDRWAGTNRKVMEDLRAAGIHPLLRRSVLAVTGDAGVLLIPAIYPTIHASVDGEGVTMGWVRWRKV